MSEAYLIAGAQGPIHSLSGKTQAEQARPILEDLFSKAGITARRVQEVHWVGGDEEFWRVNLEDLNSGLAHFQWPPSPLLAHYLLQACAREIEAGECELALLGQQSGEQAVALLLASPAAVGRYNLLPSVRLGPRLAYSTKEGVFLSRIRTILENNSAQDEEEEQAEQEPTSVAWLAASQMVDEGSLEGAFPSAQWLLPESSQPAGDLFMLQRLVERLAENGDKHGLLLSAGPHDTGLATLVEWI